ncbi:MAG: UPF0147 family protein [Candidatus Aenigmarchaeota archaeon]|nr:UPF0147 family protein [Candidatus Aenigmarchaeota archaeon]
MSNLESVIKLLGEILEDRTVPRNIKAMVEQAKNALEDKNSDLNLRLSTAISNLDEIINDPNMPMYTRTQIWNIVSILESLKKEE